MDAFHPRDHALSRGQEPRHHVRALPPCVCVPCVPTTDHGLPAATGGVGAAHPPASGAGWGGADDVEAAAAGHGPAASAGGGGGGAEVGNGDAAAVPSHLYSNDPAPNEDALVAENIPNARPFRGGDGTVVPSVSSASRRLSGTTPSGSSLPSHSRSSSGSRGDEGRGLAGELAAIRRDMATIRREGMATRREIANLREEMRSLYEPLKEATVAKVRFNLDHEVPAIKRTLPDDQSRRTFQDAADRVSDTLLPLIAPPPTGASAADPSDPPVAGGDDGVSGGSGRGAGAGDAGGGGSGGGGGGGGSEGACPYGDMRCDGPAAAAGGAGARRCDRCRR